MATFYAPAPLVVYTGLRAARNKRQPSYHDAAYCYDDDKETPWRPQQEGSPVKHAEKRFA